MSLLICFGDTKIDPSAIIRIPVIVFSGTLVIWHFGDAYRLESSANSLIKIKELKNDIECISTFIGS